MVEKYHWGGLQDPILLEDLDCIAKSDLPLQKLNKQAVLITGATGMIGSQLVMALLYYNDMHHADIRILALVRDERKAKKVFGDLFYHKQIRFITGDIQSLARIEEDIDYILHGASVTGSKDFVTIPVDTIKTALLGSINLLELARQKRVKGMVYLSSLEVYGVTDRSKTAIREEDYGYLDPLNVRSSYSESKRMVECTCVSYAKQYGLPVKIARLCQTFGAGVDYADSRVYAEFARCIIERKNIILHTGGETVRNYCYTRDAIRALLLILLQGESGCAYNVANRETAISIKNMAQLLINKYPDADINIEYELADAQKLGYNPEVKIELDTSRLQALGWKAEVGLADMFDRMIQSMIERNRKENLRENNN